MNLMASSEQSFFQKITYTDGIYPVLTANVIQNPNRFFAVPLIGMLVKIIILIPVFFELFAITIWWLIVGVLINPFVVLFTGKYWPHAYQIALGILRIQVKISFFTFGLTDKYPGFSLSINDVYSLDIPSPESPNRSFAVPFLGGIIRSILLIPYFIYVNILSNAIGIGVMLLAWVVVLFKGKYPEGIFELVRDSQRVSFASVAYMIGLSDRYPSFYISMKHDKIKIILIVISILWGGWNFATDFTNKNNDSFETIPPQNIYFPKK